MQKLSMSPTARNAEHCAILGQAVSVLLRTDRASFRISALKYWLQPAVLLGQIKVLSDEFGVPIAVLTWAYLSDEVAQRMARDEVVALHFSEWNEGLNLWIVDFAVVAGYGFSAARWMAKHMFREFSLARGYRPETSSRSGRVVSFRRCEPTPFPLASPVGAAQHA